VTALLYPILPRASTGGHDLVTRMTPEEKMAQITSAMTLELLGPDGLDDANMTESVLLDRHHRALEFQQVA
jgi:hypothetical protein